MPNAAVVAAALTDHSARAFALWVGGVDWLKQPGVSDNQYGVPVESIEVVENGPGGVSSLRCTLEDPSGTLPLPAAGNEILFQDITDDHPEFLGFVQAVDVRPMQPTGRYQDITAAGIEILLDWTLAPAVVTVANEAAAVAWQSAAINAGLRALKQDAPAGGQGQQSGPIGHDVGSLFLQAQTVPVSTLRESLRQIVGAVDTAQLSGDGSPAKPVMFTVDFTRGLRIWSEDASAKPDDYVTLTVDDAASVDRSNELHYTLTPADVVRSVYIIGGGGYTGTFSDGSGIVGQQAILNDSTVTTAALGAATALQYLGEFAQQVRGSLRLETYNHSVSSNHYQAGGLLTLTDVLAGLSSVTFRIFSITKHYYSNGLEDWDIAFGGLAPSFANMVRRQTRATLS